MCALEKVLMDLQKRLDAELARVCFHGDMNSALHLINAGANPIYDDGYPLIMACRGIQYPIVTLLLMTQSYGYSDEKAKAFIQKAFKITESNTTYCTNQQDNKDIAKSLIDHYKFWFKTEIHTDIQARERNEKINKVTIYLTDEQWTRLSALTASVAHIGSGNWLSLLHESNKHDEYIEYVKGFRAQ